MTNSIIVSTGNPIVDAVGKMNLTGNIIPESWYHTIINENGKTKELQISVSIPLKVCPLLWNIAVLSDVCLEIPVERTHLIDCIHRMV